MKNLKNTHRVLTYLICFSLLAFVNISCNEEDELENMIEEKETSTKIEISAKNSQKISL